MKQSEIEKKILDFWKKDDTFRKSVEKDAPEGDFVFYDGPPFATGTAHYGHIVASLMKDMAPRYWTMRGFRVERRWGWDCHGLPIENIVEQQHGFKHKKDILAYGVDKFNEDARSRVLTYVGEWHEVIERLGRWVDFSAKGGPASGGDVGYPRGGAYKTMDWEFMESIWWAFKQLYDKGLLYEAYRSMHICPRCETTLAQSEVAQGYKDVQDLSVVVKFKVKNPHELQIQYKSTNKNDMYLLAWTTTPWTLPGNAALAIGQKIEYLGMKILESKSERLKNNDVFVFSKEYFQHFIPTPVGEPELGGLSSREYYLKGEGYNNSVVKVFDIKVSNLAGLEYEPLFPYYADTPPPVLRRGQGGGFKVYLAPFVNTEEGTGIVHIAPAFGEDDMNLGKEKNLPFIQHVNMDGTFKAEVTDWAGQSVKPIEDESATDEKIVAYLKNKGLLFSQEHHTHSYPHCWRCESPLLNYAASSWFVNVTKIKDKLLKEAKSIEWMPEHIKEGRFGNWLEGARDWSISRQRFWGSVLPIWKSEDGPSSSLHSGGQAAGKQEIKVIGSIDELRAASETKITKIIFVRHAESEKNTTHTHSSALDKHPLTKTGEREAQELAKKLKDEKIDAIISSPILRARATAEAVAKKLGFKIEFDDRLLEDNNGQWEEKNQDDLNRDEQYQQYLSLPLAKRFAYKMGGAESGSDVEARVGGFINDLAKKYAGQTVVVVAHGIVSAAFDHILNKGSLEKFYYLCDYTPFAAPFFYYLNADGSGFDLHKHYIDQITLKGKNGSVLRRIPDVLDCWFESGSMPFAQLHYPFENKEKFEKNFPAQFIAEGVDQTRAWFYYLHVLSTALQGHAAFRNVVVNGIVLAEDGQKMSKRLKNYPDPMDMFEKYGADAVRYYLACSPVLRAEDLNFSEKGVEEVVKKVLLILYNVLNFYKLYVVSEQEDGKLKMENRRENPSSIFHSLSSNILDKWIMAKTNQLITDITEAYNKYDLNKATRPIAEFINELSTWYLRRSRGRFKGDNEQDKASALATLKHVLETLAKVMAPVMPFTAEYVWQELGNKESVHLQNWPKAGKIDAKVLKDMDEARKIIETGLAARAQEGIKIRQPLASVTITTINGDPLDAGHEALVMDELNIGEVFYVSGDELKVVFDTKLTDKLRVQGNLRELVRTINGMRKKAGLTPGDVITVIYQTNYEELKKVFAQYGDELKKSVIAGEIIEEENNGESIDINGEKIKLSLRAKPAGVAKQS